MGIILYWYYVKDKFLRKEIVALFSLKKKATNNDYIKYFHIFFPNFILKPHENILYNKEFLNWKFNIFEYKSETSFYIKH